VIHSVFKKAVSPTILGSTAHVKDLTKIKNAGLTPQNTAGCRMEFPNVGPLGGGKKRKKEKKRADSGFLAQQSRKLKAKGERFIGERGWLRWTWNSPRNMKDRGKEERPLEQP